MFSKNLGINPLVLDQLQFYRVEEILNAYEDMTEEENKQQTAQQQKQEKEMKMPQPNYGGFKVPKVEMPHINMPKF